MDVVWIIFLFALGACLGSFLNVVIYRMPRNESIVFPASHCPACGTAIKWHDNIPLVSWVALRACCRACNGRISPRYFLIELLTAALVSGLYVCYFVLRLRDDAGDFARAWPMFAAHAGLLCGLLACSAVDIELFIVLLPVMWLCTGAGIASAALSPHRFMPPASAEIAALSVAAVVGLLISEGLLRLGLIQPSFLDADDKASRAADKGAPTSPTVGITKAHGVNPRVEILRELVFLAPAIVLGAAGYLVVKHVPAVGDPLSGFLHNMAPGGWIGRHVAWGLGAAFGALVGAAWIWGTRIAGTLTFGKEAMGMGDVHILAAVGGVCGWKVASLTFFAAPIFGLGWALYLLAARGKRELPYGPWLALGALMVMLFYDGVVGFIVPPAGWAIAQGQVTALP